ncbi:MAG: hypothetical protein WBM41_09060 [Arenicellales bacterium]
MDGRYIANAGCVRAMNGHGWPWQVFAPAKPALPPSLAVVYRERRMRKSDEWRSYIASAEHLS